MEYKVLIRLFVPEIEEEYELYVPVNKTVGELARSLTEIVNNISKTYPVRDNALLCNRRTGNIYMKENIIIKTDIRNGTELVLF